MPSVKSFETDMKRARMKKRAKRNIKNLSFILAVIIIVGLVYLSRDAWIDFFDGILDRHRGTQTVQNDGELAGGNYPIDISKKTHTQIGKISKYWSLFADTTFYVYDESGDIVYSDQAPYSNPIIKESEKRALIYDQGGYNFTVAGPKNEVYSKRISDQILLGSIGPDGSVAIVTANEKYMSYLTVYDKSGSEIYHWADGTMITAVAISSNGKSCLVSCSYARGGTFRTVVTGLSFNSVEVAMQTVALDTLGLDVSYCDGGFWLLGRDRLYRINPNGGVEMNFGYEYELADYALGEDCAALIFETAEGNEGLATIIPASDEEISTASVSGDVHDCLVSDRAVYILSDEAAEAYAFDGTLLATAPLDAPYRSCVILGGDMYLLGYRSVEKIAFDF